MPKNILRFVARTFAVLLAAISLMSLVQAGPDLQGDPPVVISRVLAIILPAGLAWFLWRLGAKRVTSVDGAGGADVGR